MVKTKEQIVYDLLFNQKITPEEAEILMQEPQRKHDTGTWKVPNDFILPNYPDYFNPNYPVYEVYETTGSFHCKLVGENQDWIINN